MVHPYLRRRAGDEKVEFPSPHPDHGPADELRQVLGKTMGVPLFQEQAMRLAMVAAKFSGPEANELRRAMATFRRRGTIERLHQKMVGRMTARGYPAEFVERCFNQIKGFGEYGFPESHAASFAHLVYVSAWIKCHYPAAFAAALLNAQPMGFYAPAQIVRDAEEHGVEVRPVDVSDSHWDNTLELSRSGALALRLGFRQAEGIREAEAERIVAARSAGFDGVETLAVRAGLPAHTLRALADADSFRSLGLDRRQALWAVRRLPDDDPLPLFAAAKARELAAEADAKLPAMPLGEHVAADYQTVRLSLKGHPMGILRPIFASEGIATTAETSARPDGRWTRTAGVVLVRQRPGNGKAIFITLEDETGIVNVVVWPKVFENNRRVVMTAQFLLVRGRIQREGLVIHVVAEELIDLSDELKRLGDGTADLPKTDKEVREGSWKPKSRDFH
jgi:error-prone DNA polymerase